MASDTVAGFGSSSINNSVASGIHDPDMSREKLISLIQHYELPTTGSSKHYISIGMPPSPTLKNMEETTSVVFSDLGGEINFNKSTILSSEGSSNSEIQMPYQVKFYSQQLHSGTSHFEAGMKNIVTHNHPHDHQTCMGINELQEDKRFDSFKTWSGKLERQISNLVGKHHEPQLQETSTVPNDPAPHQEIVPVYRYFDALEGPELETLRASEEELVLPKERLWPFLLRFPVSAFGICLGINSQAILWKSLATSSSTEFLHISSDVNYVLWNVGLAVTAIVSIIYSLKAILYFEAVRREYYHPIRVNFFFAPWIAYLFIVIGLPRQITKTLPHSTWYVLTAPILVLDLKIYGQWMSGGARKLSKVANASNHLAIVGNFVGAMLGASMGLTEGPLFFFAVGVAHYTVLFVTLYQRLPTNETLPKELYPVFFLFVAAPSVASMAWAGLQGSFDYGSRIVYFVALFLYVSLAVRVNFFRGFKFSLAWWAYTFPMTAAAIATIAYANEVQNPVTRAMLITLSAISSLTVSALFVFTALHAFVPRNLFPNDIAIAISHRRPKAGKRRSHKRYESSEYSHEKDVEAAMNNTRV